MSTAGFAPEELEFFAEDSVVTVVPNQQFPVFYLLSGDVGPMEPSVPVDVPLWLAVHMRKRKQCRLVPPDWLNTEFLTEAIKNETEVKTPIPPDTTAEMELTPVPPHYVAMSHVILEHFSEELPNSVEIRRLVKDLLDKRLTKLRIMIEEHFKRGNRGACIANLTQMELCSVRSLLLKGMDQMDLIRGTGGAAARAGASGLSSTATPFNLGIRSAPRRTN